MRPAVSLAKEETRTQLSVNLICGVRPNSPGKTHPRRARGGASKAYNTEQTDEASRHSQDTAQQARTAGTIKDAVPDEQSDSFAYDVT